MKENITILGVRIDNFSAGEIKEKISDILEQKNRQKFVTTLNPEILLKAHRDEIYRDILNSADLNICDGFGLKLVSFLKGRKIRERFAGADLVDFLLGLAADKKQKILIIATKNSLSTPAEIEQTINQKYPDLFAKSKYYLPSQDFFKNGIMNQIEIVFVNFGAPEQEKFIFENRTKFPNVKILVGVGGTFDFLTGKIRRAPHFMRLIGLEWLWRLMKEPKRIKRIWNAVVIFPLLVLKDYE
jgi:N-acetylglucosaminyldiphosphoundecaprenol N-acetyl-beta-D-mannosaminyltransferase